MKRLLLSTLLAASIPLFCADVRAGAYVSGSDSEPDARTHARSFSGYGGEQEAIRVCVDLGGDASLAIAAEPAVRNVIETINTFRSLARNTYATGADADVPAGQYDFESALLHEMLHAHGLAHPNHADESGLSGDAYYGTKSTRGPNGVFNQAAGPDGIHGSADDVRGDDVNLHWYARTVNNPGLLPDLIDLTTMIRALTALPAGHAFAANGSRNVLAALGFPDAEAAAVQGARPGEAQRHLQHDDIAMLRLARAGMDGVEGTADDYRTKLVYIGRYTNPVGETCQIPVRFDNTTAFASTSLSTARLSTNNWVVFGSQMRFNPSVNWYMTPRANTVTTIVSDLPDASAGSQPVTVRVNVAKAAGNPIAANPLGVVEVRDGPREDLNTAYCTITLAGSANETAECQLAPNAGGHRTITAEYLGYGGFDASSDTEDHAVSGTVQFSAVSSGSDPVAVGAPLDVHWTLGPPFGAPPMSFSGSVIVKDAPDCASPPSDPAHQCSVALPGNQCSITFNTPGQRTLRLCYAGDGAASPASAALAQNVIAPRPTTTSIVDVIPSSAAPFAPLTVKVQVGETPAQGGQPRGAVEIYDGPPGDLFTSHCTITLEGTPGEIGECALVPTDAGMHTLSASFATQGAWAASTATAPLDVTQLRIARVSPNVVRAGQGTWVMVDFQITRYLETLPTGYVDVTDGTDFCRIYQASSGGCLWSSTTPGLHNLVARWSGNSTYPARDSAPFAVQVVAPPITMVSGGVRNFPDANGASEGNRQSLSANGRYLLFKSEATNFVPGDTNGVADLFVRDSKTSLIRRVNTSGTGEQANGESGDFAISGNGRYVVFSSLATNLVPNDTNGVRDVFVKDLVTDSTVRVSMHADGSQSVLDNEFEGMPTSISADGRYVAFLTFERLLTRDNNIHNDVYVKDMRTGELDLVSTASDETISNFRNHQPFISANGRYVVFASQASNFVPEDTDIGLDVYIKDRTTRQIRLVSATADGVRANSSSEKPVVTADGRYVAFVSYSHDLALPVNPANPDVYIKDMQTGAVQRAQATGNTLISGVSGVGSAPAITPDGRYLAFQLSVYSAQTGAVMRLYKKDLTTGEFTRLDRSSSGPFLLSGGVYAPSISDDGRFVSGQSSNANITLFDWNGLQDMFVYDRDSSTAQRAALDDGVRSNGDSTAPVISRDGGRVLYVSNAFTNTAADGNGVPDAFLFSNGATTFALTYGTASLAQQADSPFVSADNAWVAFRTPQPFIPVSDTNGMHDIVMGNQDQFVFFRASTDSSGAQVTTGTLLGPVTLNSNGTLIVFRATDTTLTAGDTNGFEDVFLKNRSTNATTMVSTTAAGVPGNGDSTQSMISDDGTRVAFTSLATNFAPDDTNGVADIYVKRLSDGSLMRASSAADGTQGNGASSEPSISSDGRYVTFLSAASNLVAGDDNGRVDVFLKDLATGAISRLNSGASGQAGTGGDCTNAAISGNAQWAGFVCAQAGLVDGVAAGKALAYVKNLQTGYLHLVSVDPTGAPSNAPVAAGPHAVANDGRMVFSSTANNLVPGDVLNYSDVFRSAVPSVPLIATSAAITSHTPNPSQPGQAYTVTATVTRAGGSADITGTVTIGDGSVICNATLAGSGNSASGSCALTSSTAGTKQLTANYGGSGTYAASIAAPTSHSVIAPAAPTEPFISSVVRGGGQVTVNFLPPGDPGTSPIDSYTAECGDRTATDTTTSITVGGLTNGVAVTCRVRAHNAIGYGPWSASSASVTPAARPGQPRNLALTPGNASVSVAFDPPTSDGGSAIIGYTARCLTFSASGTTSPIVVTGLTNGTAYFCSIAAVNDVGQSQLAAAGPVTPSTVPDPPAGVTATRGNGQVSVAFAAPAGNGGSAITGYTASCGSQSQNGAGSPLVVAGLANGTPVTCTVVAANARGNSAPSAPSNSVTPATLPDAPTGIVATRGNAQVSVAFVAPANNGGSAITGYTASCGSQSQTGPASPLVVTGLTNGTPVTCTVKAANDVGEGAVSASSSSVTPATVPDAPTAVVATRGNAQVSVAFVAPTNDGGSAVTGYAATCGSASQTGPASPLVVSGLANGTPVTCTVKAVNDVGEGAASASSNSVTPATVPNAPTGVVATRGNAQVSVAFVAPANNGGSAITGYTATCGSQSQTGTASPLVVSGLTNGTPVTCTVKAANDVGEGAVSASSNSVTPATVPDAPTGVVATRGNAQVSVAFVAPTNNGGSAVTSYTASCGSQSQNGTASPIVVTGLANGTPVTCTVKATNAVGTGAASAASSPVTPAAVPGAPQLASAVGTADGSGAVLTFTAPADNGGSAITGYVASCTPGTHTTNGAASPLTVTGLTPGTAYTCTVVATNKLGAGSVSNVLSVTPRILVDLAITNSNGKRYINGGSTVGWLVEVDNGTSTAATGARVRLALPAHLTNVGWVCSAQGGASCPGASGSGDLDGLVGLPAGARVSFLVSATVPPTPEQPITTTATVELSGAYGDPQTANNTAVDGPDPVGIFGNGFQ
ncbi:fibronectin type III domain-containing protein [Tahibacter sp. UC22_41]|uniref:fibronectin type III domain-containing protein n=1 Tax=Tahibacter sp. UC22_41 TaxID=3350178 RepID=UPI0036DEA2B2